MTTISRIYKNEKKKKRKNKNKTYVSRTYHNSLNNRNYLQKETKKEYEWKSEERITLPLDRTKRPEASQICKIETTMWSWKRTRVECTVIFWQKKRPHLRRRRLIRSRHVRHLQEARSGFFFFFSNTRPLHEQMNYNIKTKQKQIVQITTKNDFQNNAHDEIF